MRRRSLVLVLVCLAAVVGAAATFGPRGAKAADQPVGTVNTFTPPNVNFQPPEQTVNPPWGMTDVATAPDGSVWFSGGRKNALGRIDQNGNITVYKVPQYATEDCNGSAGHAPNCPDHIHALVVDRSGNVWFGMIHLGTGCVSGGLTYASAVGKFDPETGTFSGPYCLPLSQQSSRADENFVPIGGMAVGPGNTIWVLEPTCCGNKPRQHKVAEITQNGDVSEFNVPNCSPADDPYGSNPAFSGIVEGRDGAMYFTTGATAKQACVMRITPDGEVTDIYQIPHPYADPGHIVVGNDPNTLWFTEQQDVVKGEPGAIAVLRLDTGEITEYELPSSDAGANPYGITLAEDGTFWFTEPGTNKVGNIDENGELLREISVDKSGPYLITAGEPNGNVYFDERTTGSIGEVVVCAASNNYCND